MIHLLNFNRRFRAALRAGVKRQTMRPRRKRPIQRGDKLRLYVGLRTKAAEFLREVECRAVRPVILYVTGMDNDPPKLRQQIRSRRDFERDNAEARRDGFASYREMYSFFRALYKAEGPIHLEIIKW